MRDIVTSYGGSILLGYFDDRFKYVDKFPRKKKKEFKKAMPWLKFHKKPFEVTIEKSIPKDWWGDNHSFALVISKTPIGNERHVFFSVVFDNDVETRMSERVIFYKKLNSKPVKNI